MVIVKSVQRGLYVLVLKQCLCRAGIVNVRFTLERVVYKNVLSRNLNVVSVQAALDPMQFAEGPTQTLFVDAETVRAGINQKISCA